MDKPKYAGIVHIIACGVFKPALDYLNLEARFPNLRITYLSSNLHLHPQILLEQLRSEFESSPKSEKIICLYGNCAAGIDDLCEEYGVVRVSGEFCHDILLGPSRFRQCIDETAGTYFIEQEVLQNFEVHCTGPLDLNDELMRKYCFEHYQRLMYIRQPADPDLLAKAKEIAEFLELGLEIREVDYSYLERKLIELIQD
ncbi:MAG: DUF1638 domain-containing protein [Dehalococcoidia bacterium]